jgi:tetratricopeptide (TPR) repeat protein
LGEVQGLTYTRGNLGLVHHKRGEYTQAIEIYEQVAKMCESAGDDWGIAVFRYNLGEVFHLIGDPSGALSQLTTSIALCRQENIQDLLVKALALNGKIYLEIGKIEEAMVYSQEAFSVAEQTGSDIHLGIANQAMGETLGANGELEIAEQHFQKSIELLIGARVQEELAEAHIAYGIFLAHEKQMEEAKTHWSDAIQIFEQIGASSRVHKIQDELMPLGNT